MHTPSAQKPWPEHVGWGQSTERSTQTGQKFGHKQQHKHYTEFTIKSSDVQMFNYGSDNGTYITSQLTTFTDFFHYKMD